MALRVAVVGGGAAGILAAWRASQLGAKVTIHEKTERLGTKILISGGGKCNITHDGPIEDVLRAFRKNEALFLRPSLYRFTNQDIVRMLADGGLETYTRENGRVFPTDGVAKDVVGILARILDRAGVTVRFRSPIKGLVVENGRATGLLGDAPMTYDRIVVCTGGSSYPNSGTTGDGWPWFEELGHRIVKVRAALAPIQMVVDEQWTERAGISLRDCLLKAKQAGKELARWQEDLLFTHRGVSGPCALGISREVAESSGGGPIDLVVDLRPDQPFELVAQEVQAWLAANPKRTVATLVENYLPARLAPQVLAAALVTSSVLSSNLDRKSRNRLVETLKGWTIGRVRDVPIEKGEVVAGGIHLDDVDPKTMASRLVENLFVCGEALDIAGPVGGYNLQAAWSTGYVAGESAAG